MDGCGRLSSTPRSFRLSCFSVAMPAGHQPCQHCISAAQHSSMGAPHCARPCTRCHAPFLDDTCACALQCSCRRLTSTGTASSTAECSRPSSRAPSSAASTRPGASTWPTPFSCKVPNAFGHLRCLSAGCHDACLWRGGSHQHSSDLLPTRLVVGCCSTAYFGGLPSTHMHPAMLPAVWWPSTSGSANPLWQHSLGPGTVRICNCSCCTQSLPAVHNPLRTGAVCRPEVQGGDPFLRAHREGAH